MAAAAPISPAPKSAGDVSDVAIHIQSDFMFSPSSLRLHSEGLRDGSALRVNRGEFGDGFPFADDLPQSGIDSKGVGLLQ
jgi:hypothetical protein